MQQCGRSHSEWFSFSTTLLGNNGKWCNYFQQFCKVPFHAGSCTQLYFLHLQLSLGLCITKLAQKENSPSVYHGLRLLYKAEGFISSVDNDGLQQAVFPVAGPPAGWAEHLFSGCIALCPVGGRARRVGNDLRVSHHYHDDNWCSPDRWGRKRAMLPSM